MSIQQQLQDYFSNQYRKIWIQRSSVSICVILFPLDSTKSYEMVVELFWLRDNELNFENVRNLVLKYKKI